MSRRAPVQRALGHCRAIGCAELIAQDALFCDRHDRMLQSDIKTILTRQHRPGRKPSKVFELTLGRALAEILYAQQNGHRVPRLAEFEWDDPPPIVAAPVEPSPAAGAVERSVSDGSVGTDKDRNDVTVTEL